MKILFIINLLSIPFLYSGCANVKPKWPQYHPVTPDAGLFPVGDKYSSVLQGQLRSKGPSFEKAAKQYNLPVSLLVGISAWETGRGKSRAVREKNNCGGLMRKGKLISFSNVDESINYLAKNLRLNYFNKGLVTVEKIRRKYAPYNAEWSAGVRKMQREIK